MKLSPCLLALLVAVGATGALAAEKLELAVGEHRVVKLGPLARVATGDPKIADIQLKAPDGVEVIGVGAGRAVLLFWTTAGEKKELEILVGGATGAAPAAPAAPAGGAPARFGGVVLPGARCETAATRAAEDAQKRGESLAKSKDFAGAQAAYREAIRLEPAFALPHLKLASLLARNRETAPAAAEYETFLLSCPKAPQAKQAKQILDELAKHSGN